MTPLLKQLLVICIRFIINNYDCIEFPDDGMTLSTIPKRDLERLEQTIEDTSIGYKKDN